MRIAIVEDDSSDVNTLLEYISKYSSENNVEIATSHFGNALEFLDNYRPDFDLVLLDIEMPMMNGLEGAEKLREKDKDVPLVFVTNMRQFAVKGYAVNALDFIIKPVSYFEFSTMMNKIRNVLLLREDKDVLFISGRVTRHLSSDKIRYVEVFRHKSIIHAVDGDYEAWCSLSEIQKQLPENAFAKCSNSFLLNLKYVDYIDKDIVHIGKDELVIARTRRKEFMADLMRYFGRNK